jgi:GT2 family glycosyltransferase
MIRINYHDSGATAQLFVLRRPELPKDSMMPFLVTRSSSGIKRADNPSHYESVTDDPRFVYRFWLRRPRFMVVFLESGEKLDPKIYVDRGAGFDEASAIALPHEGGSCVYAIAVTPPRRIKRIRIDPCSSETRFRYWADFAWNEDDKAALLESAKRDGGATPVHDIVIDGTPETRKGRKSARSVAQHYAAVTALARRTAPPVAASQIQNGPLISFVVPVHNADARHLDDLLASFREQPAGAAELILSDDGSASPATLSWLSRHEQEAHVRILHSETNRGIAAATNAGIEIARGEWVGLMDHDDALSPCAVPLLAEVMRDHPDCQFIYTDEVITNAKLKPVAYHLKPAYDEVLLSGVNYINHLSCYRRDRLPKLGGLRAGYEGSQDYDLLLRYLRGLKPSEIKHLPYPAYRWRRTAAAFSARFMARATVAARKALAEHYRRGDVEPEAGPAITPTLHRMRFETLPRQWPGVSIVIPNRDSFPLMARLLADLKDKTDYPDLEIVVSDNGTTDPRVLRLYDEARKGPIPFTVDIEPTPFNFSRQINRGIARASGELVLLLNNDIEVIEPGWLREMVCCFDYPGTGIVGARLVYPNGRLQHAGVIVGLGGLAGHWFGGQRQSDPGPMARLHVRQSLTAVTGACMMISRACLAAVGGFDETDFGVAYNDVDFCLRAGALGFRTVWTPFATLVHRESASRGSDESNANRGRFERDKAALHRRHGTETYEDRAFSPWYGRNRGEPPLGRLDRLPKAR